MTTASYDICTGFDEVLYAPSLTGPGWGFSWADTAPATAVIDEITVEITTHTWCNTASNRSVTLNGAGTGTHNFTGTACSGCSTPQAVTLLDLSSNFADYVPGGSNTLYIPHDGPNFEGMQPNTSWSTTENIYARVTVAYIP